MQVIGHHIFFHKIGFAVIIDRHMHSRRSFHHFLAPGAGMFEPFFHQLIPSFRDPHDIIDRHGRQPARIRDRIAMLIHEMVYRPHRLDIPRPDLPDIGRVAERKLKLASRLQRDQDIFGIERNDPPLLLDDLVIYGRQIFEQLCRQLVIHRHARFLVQDKMFDLQPKRMRFWADARFKISSERRHNKSKL